MGRGIDPSRYRCFIDEDRNSISFLLHDSMNRIIGCQEHLPFEVDKSYRYNTQSSGQPIWGMEYIPEDYRGVVYITESITRSIYLHKIGLYSISILGSTCSKQVLDFFLNNRRMTFVWIGDPDRGGERLLKYFGENGLTSPKDVDNMNIFELYEFKQLLEVKYGSIHDKRPSFGS